MRTFNANEFPQFFSFPLTDERYRPVWAVANCMPWRERNYVLLDRIFNKHWKIFVNYGEYDKQTIFTHQF